MIFEKIVELVGVVPFGFEPVIYCVSCIVLVWMLSCFFSIVNMFFKMVGGFRE